MMIAINIEGNLEEMWTLIERILNELETFSK